MLKMLLIAFVVAVSLCGGGVSAETHHVVGGGWGPDFNVTTWLSGRIFTVGDKIRLEYSGSDESMVEVRGLEEFVSCDVTNPIRMYTEAVNHVALEEEGVRYFTSGNPESCRKGLKLPVSVHPDRTHEFDPPPPHKPDVPSPPHKPDVPYPPPSPPAPSAATRLNALCFVVFAVLSIYCLGI